MAKDAAQRAVTKIVSNNSHIDPIENVQEDLSFEGVDIAMALADGNFELEDPNQDAFGDL